MLGKTTSVIITHDRMKYHLRILYDTVSESYGVSFCGLNPLSSTDEYIPCSSWDEAFEKFSNNCMYYLHDRPEYVQEEEFHGLCIGTLWPKAKEA